MKWLVFTKTVYGYRGWEAWVSGEGIGPSAEDVQLGISLLHCHVSACMLSSVEILGQCRKYEAEDEHI
jgi:hypothetical protein